MKDIKSYYIHKRTFPGSFESNWFINLDDYEEICANWDMHDEDKVSFFGFSLANEADARHFHDAVVFRSKQNQSIIKWKSIVEGFESKSASKTKKAEINSRLKTVTIDDFKQDEEDEYDALYRLTKRINQLAPIVRQEDRDDDSKTRFLTKAVAGTEWGLNAQQ